MGDTPLVSFDAIFDYLSKKKKKDDSFGYLVDYLEGKELKDF